MAKIYTKEQFEKWGALGSKVRKHRKLTTAQSLKMLNARWPKKRVEK